MIVAAAVWPLTGETTEAQRLDAVFAALSDATRRAILERLDAEPLLVSELAAPFDMSLQAVSRHIQVLVRAGLVRQERTGRISRCSLEAGPLFDAAVWMNRYSKYWQAQFNVLAAALEDLAAPSGDPARGRRSRPRPRSTQTRSTKTRSTKRGGRR